MSQQLEAPSADTFHQRNKNATEPLVSVIVGVYNQAQYVTECLDSICDSVFQNIELVIFNDASTDDSHQIIEHWIENHSHLCVHYLNHQINHGLTKSLNEAIREAKGEMIALLAADDRILPTGIKDRVTYLADNPSKLAVFADCRVIDHMGQLLYTSGIEGLYGTHGMKKRDLGTGRLMLYNVVAHWAVPGPVFLCRRSTYQLLGLYDEDIAIEDWDMYIRVAATGALGFVDTQVADYRVHPENLSNARRDMVKNELRKTVEKHRRSMHGISGLYLKGLYCHYKGHESTNSWAGLSLLALGRMCRLSSGLLYRAMQWYCTSKPGARRMNSACIANPHSYAESAASAHGRYNQDRLSRGGDSAKQDFTSAL